MLFILQYFYKQYSLQTVFKGGLPSKSHSFFIYVDFGAEMGCPMTCSGMQGDTNPQKNQFSCLPKI